MRSPSIGPASLAGAKAQEVTSGVFAADPETGGLATALFIGYLELITSTPPPMPPIIDNKMGELIDLLIDAFPGRS